MQKQSLVPHVQALGGFLEVVEGSGPGLLPDFAFFFFVFGLWCILHCTSTILGMLVQFTTQTFPAIILHCTSTFCAANPHLWVSASFGPSEKGA